MSIVNLVIIEPRFKKDRRSSDTPVEEVLLSATEKILLKIAVVFSRTISDFFAKRKDKLELVKENVGSEEVMPRRGRGESTGSLAEARGLEYRHQVRKSWRLALAERGGRSPVVVSGSDRGPIGGLRGMPGLTVRKGGTRLGRDGSDKMDRESWKKRHKRVAGNRPARPSRLPKDRGPLAGTGAIDEQGFHHIPYHKYRYPDDYIGATARGNFYEIIIK